jgi:hypothetical protein
VRRARRLGPALGLRAALGLALALGLAPAPTALAGDEAADEARLRARLAPEVAQQVSAVVREARAAGLPADPLLARAFEGASRGADGDGIVAGVRRLAAALGSARGALGPGSQPDEMVAGASALAAGVPADSLARLRLARPGGNLVIPLVVLCDLVARGVPVGTASQAVVTASRAGASDGALLRIRERIHSRIENGGPPAGATGEVVRQWLLESPAGSRRGAEPAAGRRKAP